MKIKSVEYTKQSFPPEQYRYPAKTSVQITFDDDSILTFSLANRLYHTRVCHFTEPAVEIDFCGAEVHGVSYAIRYPHGLRPLHLTQGFSKTLYDCTFIYIFTSKGCLLLACNKGYYMYECDVKATYRPLEEKSFFNRILKFLKEQI